jgi:processive 1,2-diacylglycerol beta-glucosyltransferase
VANLAVLCGSSERARERGEKLAAKGGYQASFLAFTDRARDLMMGASALVTKPGGMTCTEALTAGLPQVLYHPIPGQEEDNAAAMTRYGAGVVVKTTGDILGETLRILTGPDRQR